MQDADKDEKPHDLKSISGKMVRGTAWMVSMRWSLRLIGVINTVIIARLLAPDDFGVIAMAMIIVGFFTEISETNVSVALIRNKDATPDDYNSAWTIKIIMGALLMVIFLALAPIVAKYYGDPRVEIVIQIISVRSLIFAFENIGVVDFRKNLDFAKEFRYGMYRRLTEAVISLTIVYFVRDYHALAYAMLVTVAVAVFFSFTMSPYRPRLCFKKIRALWSVSQWLMIDHGARFAARRIDEFVIGPIAGSTTVGNYFMASEVSQMPTREVVIPAGTALMPTFAKVAHDENESRKAFLRVFGLIAIYAFPAGVGVSVVSPDLVPLLLGSQWNAAIPFFQWLGIYASFEAIVWGIRPYFLAKGGERAFALSTVGFACVLIPSIVAAGHMFGVMAIVMARTGLMAVMVVAMLFVVAWMRYATLGQMLSVLWRPVVASAAMWLGMHALPDMTVGWHIVPLMRDIAVGGMIFVGVDILLWVISGRPDGPEPIILDVARNRIRRF